MSEWHFRSRQRRRCSRSRHVMSVMSYSARTIRKLKPRCNSSARTVLSPAGVVEHPHLADGHRIRKVIHHPADVAVNVVHVGMVESRVAVAEHPRPHLDVGVRQARWLGHAVRHVDTETVDAAFQPEPQRLLQVVEYLRVVPVEVRLFGVEEMQIPLARLTVRLGHPGPGQPAEHRLPVVRRLRSTGSATVAEDVAVARGAARFGGQRFLKPRML